jgi:hypothetical protein
MTAKVCSLVSFGINNSKKDVRFLLLYVYAIQISVFGMRCLLKGFAKLCAENDNPSSKVKALIIKGKDTRGITLLGHAAAYGTNPVHC